MGLYLVPSRAARALLAHRARKRVIVPAGKSVTARTHIPAHPQGTRGRNTAVVDVLHGRSHSIASQPSVNLFSLITFAEQHRGASLKLIHLPWKFHLIPFTGAGSNTKAVGMGPPYCPCSALRLRLHYRRPPSHLHTGKSQREQMI